MSHSRKKKIDLKKWVKELDDGTIKEFLQYPKSYGRVIGTEVYPLLKKEAKKRDLEIILQEKDD